MENIAKEDSTVTFREISQRSSVSLDQCTNSSFESLLKTSCAKTPPESNNSTVDTWKVSSRVLIIDEKGSHIETLAGVVQKYKSEPDYREPDTPCGSVAISSQEEAGLNERTKKDEFADCAVSQGTYSSLLRRTTSLVIDSVIANADKVIQYLEFSSKYNFDHSPRNVPMLLLVLQQLCGRVKKICSEESMLLRLPAPTYVFGDIHGNYDDLSYFLRNLLPFWDCNFCSHSLLFLGDYVDRGDFSVECVVLLFALKVKAPGGVFLLRGNHEDFAVNGDEGQYGKWTFFAQCKSIFGEEAGAEVWNLVNDTFSCLPLAAVIEKKIFCCHGGIPRYAGQEPDNRLKLLEEVEFPRFRSIIFNDSKEDSPYRQLAFDLVWSDPSETEDFLNEWGFGANPRGATILTFGKKAVEQFLKNHNLNCIIRAHQEKSDGVRISKHSKVLTIFSSSGYCGHNNGAGVVFVSSCGVIRMVIKARQQQQQQQNLQTS